MIRRQIINITTRYSHQHCEKNIPQINCNNFFENNDKKLDLIQKKLQENNEQVSNLHGKLDIVFVYSFFSTIILVYKSI
jgi:hypothetical protein